MPNRTGIRLTFFQAIIASAEMLHLRATCRKQANPTICVAEGITHLPWDTTPHITCEISFIIFGSQSEHRIQSCFMKHTWSSSFQLMTSVNRHTSPSYCVLKKKNQPPTYTGRVKAKNQTEQAGHILYLFLVVT